MADARRRSESDRAAIYKYQPHRFLGYIPAPGFERGGNRHNEWGFRGQPFPREKPLGEFRIFCLGGSTTYTSFVQDSDLSYPSLLEDELRQRGYSGIRVINAGVEGWTSHESLINFQLRILDFSPDLIVVYHAVNDLSARIVWPPEAYRGDNSGAVRDSSGWNSEPAALDRSVALRIVRIRLGYRSSPLSVANAFGGMAPTSHFWHFASLVAQDRYPDDFFEEHPLPVILEQNPPTFFERNLENLLVSAQHHGVAAVLSTLAAAGEHQFPPVKRPSNQVDYAAALRQHNDVVRAVGEKLGVPVFDFAREFPRREELFQDPIHVSEAGARAKAEYFARYLAESGLLPPPS